MSAPDRPTREQVDADLARADLVHSGGTNEVRLIVSARRARKLDRAHSALRHESDAHVAERDRLRAALAARTPQPAEFSAVVKLRATIALLGDLADRSLHGELGTEELCREREERIELLHSLGHSLGENAVAPLPAVPDGGGDMFGVTCVYCGEAVTDARPSVETEMGATHVTCCDDAPAVPDGEDEAIADRARHLDRYFGLWVLDDKPWDEMSHEEAYKRGQVFATRYIARHEVSPADAEGEDEPCGSCGHDADHSGGECMWFDDVRTDDGHMQVACHCDGSPNPDTDPDDPLGEDVPARLDAAADACGPAGVPPYTGERLRGAATALRLMPAEVRAAVAAALSRPTGGLS